MRSFVGAALLVACALVALVVVESTARRLRPEARPEVILSRLAGERQALRTPDAVFHHLGEGIVGLDFPASEIVALPRILIVGDSFAMGHGVAGEQRLGKLLARSLDGVAVVDMLGTTSYSPIVYRNIVRRALQANPYACVAVFVDQTDPSDDVIYRKDLASPRSREFDLSRMRDRIAILSATYDRIEAGFAGWRGLARKLAFTNALFPPPTILEALPPESPHRPYVELSLARARLTRIFDDEPESDLARTMATSVLSNLDETIGLARSGGAHVLLAANPWEDQVSTVPRVARAPSAAYPRDNRLERILAERYGRAQGVTVLGLTAAFRSTPEPSSLFVDEPAYEVHWNAEGHALVAQVLEEALDRHVLGSQIPIRVQDVAALSR